MAKSYDNNPNGPGKSGGLSDVQRRAQQMANKPQVSPTQFFQEAWVELKKTTWPNRDVLTKSTSVVLALVAAVAIWVGGIDALLTRASTWLFTAGR